MSNDRVKYMPTPSQIARACAREKARHLKELRQKEGRKGQSFDDEPYVRRIYKEPFRR